MRIHEERKVFKEKKRNFFLLERRAGWEKEEAVKINESRLWIFFPFSILDVKFQDENAWHGQPPDIEDGSSSFY